MRQATTRFTVPTPGQGLTDITPALRQFTADHGMQTGLLTVWCRHTSASLIVQENADADVRKDLVSFLRWLVPEGEHYRHKDEGPDDMPAHIKSALTLTQVSIPLIDGALALGTWQAVYLFEHRTAPHEREIVLHLLGG